MHSAQNPVSARHTVVEQLGLSFLLEWASIFRPQRQQAVSQSMLNADG